MVDMQESQAKSTAKNIFQPAHLDIMIQAGSLVILYLSRDLSVPVVVRPGESANTRYGQYSHAAMIGLRFGSKMISTAGHGYCYLLRPTPELWSLSLPHRTQILYMPDISFITSYLDIKPGQRVIEAGTGSGSFTHSLARTIGSSGKIYSFEFHEERCDAARKEFISHGIDHLIQLQHRNVCKDGFGDVKGVDSIFLDLPAPWEAIPHAKQALSTDCMTRICCFSPCIEQVIKTVAALTEQGFSNITMYESLVRQQEIVRDSAPTVADAIKRLKEIETRKQLRREVQIEQSRELKVAKLKEATLKRKAEEMDVTDAEEAVGGLTVPTPEEVPLATAPVLHAETPSDPRQAEEAGKSKGTSATATPAPEVETSNAPSPAPGPPPHAGKSPLNEDRKYLAVKPAIQTRGHTSFLTFAFLLPLAVPPGASEQRATQETAAPNGTGRESYASEYAQIPSQDLVDLVAEK